MSVTSYQLQVLSLDDFDTIFDIPTILTVIRAWRNKCTFEAKCSTCQKQLDYRRTNFHVCCLSLHLNPTKQYIVKSVVVRTPGIHLLPVYLKSKLVQQNGHVDQEFLVLPDPIYWQLESTLIYDPALNFLANPFKNDIGTSTFINGSSKKKTGSFHKDAPQLNAKLLRLYARIQNAPLYHRSLTHRTQGKESLYRKIAIPKRAEKTARTMILPAPHLRPNEVVLPRVMANMLGKWVIVNRMPTLAPENFVALRVVQVWDSEAAGLPGEVWRHLNCDFDGDEINLLFVTSAAAQAECEHLLNSENNMKSFSHHLKLYPSQDALVAYYLRPMTPYPLLPFLRTVFEMEGSKSCFDWFDRIRQHYLNVLENEVSFSVCLKEFDYLRRVAKNTSSFEAFEQTLKIDGHEEMCLEVQVNSGAKGTYYHLYQLVGCVGLQKLDTGFGSIQSSFFDGLTPEEYVIHAKSGHEALLQSSLMVWRPGYLFFKLINSTQNIIVDYEGRLMDGEDQVLYQDALEDVYYEDVMSHETFDYIFNRYFGDE